MFRRSNFFCNVQRLLLKVISPKFVELVDIDISKRNEDFIIEYFGEKLGLGVEVAQLGLLG